MSETPPSKLRSNGILESSVRPGETLDGRITVILGMHRSGTSAVARALHGAGLFLGDGLQESTGANLLGYWESTEAVRINDAILRQCGGSWSEVPRDVRADEKTILDMTRFLEALRTKPFSGWKDPRTTLTFDAWKPMLGQRVVVGCFRHPLSVAHSLRERDGWPIERGLGLWTAYNEILLRLSEAEERFVWFDYDAGPAAWNRSIRQVCEYAGVRAPDDASRPINPALKHHVFTGPSGSARADVLLSDLRHKAGRTGPRMDAARPAKADSDQVLESLRALSLAQQKAERQSEERARSIGEALQQRLSRLEDANGLSEASGREAWERVNALNAQVGLVKENARAATESLWERIRTLEAALHEQRESSAGAWERSKALERALQEQRESNAGAWERSKALERALQEQRESNAAAREKLRTLESAILARLGELESSATFFQKTAHVSVDELRKQIKALQRLSESHKKMAASTKALWERVNAVDAKTALAIEGLKMSQTLSDRRLAEAFAFVQHVRRSLPFVLRRRMLGHLRRIRFLGARGLVRLAEKPAPLAAGAKPPDAAGNGLNGPSGPQDVRLIAFYLPQFHPIPENDAWWGEGFTEWTNVSRAVPNFKGHYQPRLPGPLGFYDLRLPETLKRQTELARRYGIHGFCFYYYWFNGRRVLEKPLDLFLQNPSIDFPFCLCWANENWTRRWDGGKQDILIEQTYSDDSHARFIRELIPALRDPRYIRINGKPLVMVYRANLIPDAARATAIWRTESMRAGAGEIYLMAAQTFGLTDPRPFGFDAAVEFPPHFSGIGQIDPKTLDMLNPDYTGKIYDYREIADRMLTRKKPDYDLFRTVMTSWDNTARMQNGGHIFIHSSPDAYRKWLAETIHDTALRFQPDSRLVFINAWNEWAEGAHLEPDRRYGYAYLQATADAVESAKALASVAAPVP